MWKSQLPNSYELGHFCVHSSLLNIYRPQRSWAKVIFSQASVCPGGVCLPQCMLGYTPPPGTTSPWDHNPPGTTHPPRPRPPWDQSPGTTPPRADPSPPGSRLQLTVNERPVRILPECILVGIIFLYQQNGRTANFSLFGIEGCVIIVKSLVKWTFHEGCVQC